MGPGFRVWGLGFRTDLVRKQFLGLVGNLLLPHLLWGLDVGFWVFGVGVCGLGFWVWGLGFGVWGLGFGFWVWEFGLWD